MAAAEKKFIDPGRWSADYDEQGNDLGTVYDRSYRALLGYAPDEEYACSHQAWLDSIHPEDRERIEQHLAEVFARHPEGMDYGYEYRMMTRKGYRWFHDYARVTRREDGSVAHMEGIIFDMQETLDNFYDLSRNAQDREALIARMSEGESLYIVNPATERFRVLNQNAYLADNYKEDEDFNTSFSRYIATDVFEPDRAMVTKAITVEQMVRHLAQDKEYIVQYRDISSGAPRWYEMRAVRLSDSEILYGFTDRDNEIILGHLDEQEREQDLALLAVDIDNGTVKFIKTNPYDPQYSVGEVRPYNEVMEHISSGYEGEVRDFYNRISDAEKLRSILAMNYKHTYTYRALFSAGQWMNISGYVVARHEDGTPATAVLCFALVDTLGSDKAEYLERFKENMEIIGGMATEYTAIYYVNLDTGSYKPYYLTERVEDINASIKSSPCFVQLAHAFADSEMVHPDDRAAIRAIYVSDEALRQALGDKKKLGLFFRRNYGGTYLWTELEIIKCEPAEEEAHRVIVSFRECDNEVRTEQTMAASLAILSKENAPDECINELLRLVGDFYAADRAYIFENIRKGEAIRNTYEWCASGIEPMQEHLQNIPMKEVEGWNKEFRRRGAFLMEALDSKYNNEATVQTLEMQGIRSLMAAPIMNGAEITGFIGVDNPSKAGKNTEVLRRIAAVAYSEILKRNELAGKNAFTGSFLEPFISAYYIGLDDLSCEIYKRNESLQELYPDVSSYLESVSAYINRDVHPEDRDVLLQALRPESIRKRLTEQTQYSLIYRDLSGGVEKIYRCQVIRGMDENHAALGFLDITAEVAEQKAAQDRLQRTLDAAREANEHNTLLNQIIKAGQWEFCFDNEDNIVESNISPECKAVAQNDDLGEGYEWTRLLHPEDSAPVEKGLREALADRSCQTPFDMDYRIRASNGEYHWLHSAGRMRRNPDGSGVLFGICINIDDSVRTREEHQRQLEQALAMAQSASEAKSSFLFNMSHDIRTPMNAITGFTAMAKKYLEDKEKAVDYLNKIDASGKQLLALVNQVLEMARIESGKIVFDDVPVNIRERFETMVTILEEQAQVCGLKFRHSLRNITHYNILADDARMSQITLNIVGNAMKYTHEGGTVEFSLEEKPCEKEGFARYTFTVADTGIGMSEEFLKVLFEPFAREKSSTVSHIQGTGLGLSIVKKLVDLRDGTIDVRSAPGKGTRFDITIDFELDKQEGAGARAETGVGAMEEKHHLMGKKVLLVEDNELNREIAKDVLEELGLLVDEADDGDVAVKLVCQKGAGYYDCILMDIQMPRMNGYEATQEIRKLPGAEKLPIIALSANVFDEDKRKSLQAGMDDHVAKPIDISTLVATLAKFLR